MRLLVIEGVDGAGKSTQIKMLRDYLQNEGYNTEFLHFPRTDAPYFGELVARFLRGEFGSLSEVSPWLVAMLYAGDRKDAADMISDWLRNGSYVLLDRYTYSNIAYQCAKLSSGDEQDRLMNWILDLEFSHFGITVPDLNIFLDVPFQFTERKLLSSRTGDDRNYLNGNRDIHEESLDFQRNVRNIYLKVAAKDERLCVVDCGDEKGNMMSPEAISAKVLGILKEKRLL